MKVYVDTWFYVTKKFGNMGFIEVYRGVLRYENGIYPTIPNFIVNYISFVWDDFSDQKTHFCQDEETSIIQQIILYRMDSEFSIGRQLLLKK